MDATAVMMEDPDDDDLDDLDDPIVRAVAAAPARRPPPRRVGARIGAYRVVRPLGAGGMGAVYLAERDDGAYEQRVAIKVLRSGIASPPLVARFRDERQALATLDHHGIVRLLDGGQTDDGDPYLVMEYVDGVPFAEHARGLAVRARVELVVRVADALQAAHQGLVVHRDVKPSNLLVDCGGVPKLLDFGIAKLLEPEGACEPRTRTDMVAFTAEYASPEQVRGERVSVATDIYSLGAVLYDVLVGRPPQSPGATPLDTLHAICERDPVRPSAAAPALHKELAGDLDNIVMKALAKRPEQRYASMADFARDLRAYLDGLPVAAREATFGYRARKLIARHRGKLALGTAIAVALSTTTVLAIAQARRADEEAQRARAERRELLVVEGRRELSAGRGARALPYLVEALRAGADTPGVRFLIAAATQPYESRLATMPTVDGYVRARWWGATRILIESMGTNGTLFDSSGGRLVEYAVDDVPRTDFAASSAGDVLATLDIRGRLRAWNVATGRSRWIVDGAHPPRVASPPPGALVWAADGRLITGGADRRVAIRDGATGSELAAVEVGDAVIRLAATRDGAWIAAAGRDRTIALLDGHTLAARGTVSAGHDVGQLAFSADGERLYVAANPVDVQIWDVAARALVATVPGTTFDLDTTQELLITGGGDAIVRVWGARTGGLRREFVGHEWGYIQAVRWSHDGSMIASAGGDGTFRLWDATTAYPLVVLETPAGAGDHPSSPSGAFAVEFSPDDTRLLTLSGTGAAVWRVEHGRLLEAHAAPGPMYAITWAPDERHAASVGCVVEGSVPRAVVSVWDGDRVVATTRLATTYAYDVTWSPDGTRFVIAARDRIANIYRADGTQALALVGHGGHVFRASFGPDGARVATASGDRSARVWDAATGQTLLVLPHPDAVMAAAWSHDGTRLVTTCSDHRLRIWNAATGQLELELDGGAVQYLDATFSPDDRVLAAAGHGAEAEIWDLATARRRFALEGHTANTITAVWSPDGGLVATTSSDHTTRVWDASTGALLATFLHPHEVTSAQWSRDGRRLLTAAFDGVARVWDVHRTTASLAELDAFLTDRVPYRLVEGKLVHIQLAR